MRDTEQAILQVFKTNPSKEFETSELAKEIFTEDYAIIEEKLRSLDKVNVHDAKRRKFRLHRKLLYYLNKLVAENILLISRIKEKGEKTFALALEEGDITLEKGYKKIIISKPNLPSNQIQLYEKQKIMKKYEEDSWINRFNSLLIECSKAGTIDRLSVLIHECFNDINDALALNDFELLLNAGGKDDSADAHFEDIRKFMGRLIEDSVNLDKTVSIILNPSNADHRALKEFIGYFASVNPKNINVIFNIDHKELQKLSDTFEYIIAEFSRQKIKLNIKNKEVNSAPFFKGRAGIYNFDEEEWRLYQKSVKGNVFGLGCSQSAIAININKFFEEYKTDKEFRTAIMNAAKVLLLANAIQRRKSNEYFRKINLMNSPYSADFYKFSRNYIRFWNYDWHKDIEENNNLFDLIKSTKELVDNFCYSEETIFKSCGIPIRFKIVFSSAFRNFDPVFMGERDYTKANVKRSEDYYKGEIKEFIMIREKMFEIFDGGDRLRIFRSTDFKTTDIMHELGIVLSSFKIPFFTYDFSELRGTVKLTNYI